ncbi:MAG: HEAT repeat domain-containing protein [Myxococcales bacterium]|nr:HEAT repeat domain-containing protein [Myxococcales bacterium]
MTFGPQLERLLAIAASTRAIAIGGRRDAAPEPAASVHLLPRGKAKARTMAVGAAVHALAFVDDDLLLAGCGDGRVRGWVVGDGEPTLRVDLDLGAAVRALLVVDGASVLAATADGALHRLALAVVDARPTLTVTARVAVAERALDAVAVESGVVVVGGVDGAWVVDGARARPLAVGGDGGVRALVGLGDGRVIAGTGDGAIRTAYVAGDAEASDRAGAHAHAGAVRALALGPLLIDPAGREQPRRLWSLGDDGALKSWPLDSNRKPRTLELGAGAGAALAIAPGAVKGVDGSTAQVLAATAARKVVAQTLGADGEPVGAPAITTSELDRLAAELDDHKPKSQSVRAAAVATLAALPEDDARVLLERALAREPMFEIKAAAATALATGGRRRARPALRTALADGHARVRAAAFAALCALDPAEPLAPIRAGLAARADDVRLLALDALAAQPAGSLTAALAAEAFTDPVPAVRERGFAVARALGAADPRWAVRTALARGPADLRARALFTLGLVDRAADAAARGLIAAALDDDSPEVRWAAYAVALCGRPRTAGRLRALDSTLATNLVDAAARVGVAEAALPPPTTEPVTLDDDERGPLFQAMACRQPETALRGARGLIYLGDARALGAVLGLSRDPDAGVRRAAVDALAVAARLVADDDRALARLGWLLDDDDAQVRGAAMAALIDRTGGAAEAELDLAELALRASQADVRTARWRC